MASRRGTPAWCVLRSLALLLVAGTAAAEEKPAPPEPDTAEQAADKSLTAISSKDLAALKEIASRDDPDPWLVADELLARGKADEAEAFAKAAPRPDVERLPEYVAAQRGRADETETEARRVRAAVHELLVAGRPADALAAAEASRPAAGTVTAVQIEFKRALALRELGRLEEGSAAFLRLAESTQRIGWLAKVADSYRQAGILHAWRGDFRAAVAAWERELAVSQGRANPAEVAIVLGNLGLAHWRLGNLDAAIDCGSRALELHEQVGNREGIASALMNLAAIHQTRGEHRRAIELNRRALSIARERQDRASIAMIQGNVGLSHWHLQAWDDALGAMSEALKLYEELGDRSGISRTLGNLGLLRESQGEHAEALKLQERALSLAEQSKDPSELAQILGNIGSIHQRRGDYEEAMRFHERALKIERELGLPHEIAESLGIIGLLRTGRGEFAEAAACHEECVRLLERMGDRAGAARALLRLADVRASSGAYGRALAEQERALEMLRALDDRAGVAHALSSMGTVHAELGALARALELEEAALALTEETGDREVAAGILVNIGMAHRGLGQHAQALEDLGRAGAMAEKLGNKAVQAMILGNIGVIQDDLGEHGQALATYERALKLKEEIGDRPGAAATLAGIGYAHRRLGRYERALESDERALALAQEIGDRGCEVWALQNLACTLVAMGRPAEAAARGREAVLLLSRLAGGVADEQGAAARSRFRDLLDAGIVASVALQDVPLAAFFLESARAGALLESLLARKALQSAVIPPDLLAAERGARAKEAAATEALARSHDAQDLEQIRSRRADLDEARKAVLDAIQRIQRSARSAADLVYPVADDVAVIQRRLRADEALVLYGLVEGAALALVIEPAGARLVPLAATSEITMAAETLRKALTAPLGDARGIAAPARDEVSPEPAAASLRRLLIDPLRIDARTKRLLISPEGALAYLPFALFAQGLEIAYVPSGTVYGVLLDDAAKKGEGVLALGDPEYGAEPPWELAAGGGTLARLPATADEAKAVGTVVLLGRGASEEGFRAALAGRPRWRAVHIATHGLVDPERPLFSSLALTPSGEDDGFLTAIEVFRVKVPADLVVLSACETGRGKLYAAEGIVGLTRAFMFAGAPRVLVSLWNVDDDATRALMVKFYEAWNAGRPAAAALSDAQAFVRSKEQWRHPRFWAAWTLWGLPE